MKNLIRSRVKNLDEYLNLLWSSYVEITPQAQKIHDLFEAKGEKIVNDHIALRTLSDSRVDLDVLSETFLQFGYKKCDEYHFKEKKLLAYHFEHRENSLAPKIFISQLKLDEMSSWTQKTLQGFIDAFVSDSSYLERCMDINLAERNWSLDHATYQKLYEESEYAAWFAVFGFRVNHFTVDVNSLKSMTSIQAVNTFLKQQDFILNSSGGEVKGTPDLLLEQSSTMASEVSVRFSDGEYKIPSCYYEFARRYQIPGSNKFYQGFVAQSADKIFESTNRLR